MRTLQIEHARAGWTLWLQWVLLSTLGWIVGGFTLLSTSYALAQQLDPALGRIAAGALGIAAGGALAGLMVGVAQWLVLQHWIEQSSRWIWLSAASIAVGAVLNIFVATSASGDARTLVLAGGAAGALLGGAQWLVLRGQVAPAGWWIPANILALATLFVLADTLGGEGQVFPALLASGAACAGVTGGALAWLLRRRAA
jgi:hypothetical protein